jgi:hypothetical protein
MLFDLRSRGRRRTVQAVYLGLALVLGLGLVLFGVGAGNGIGGLLNAFTGNGSGSNQSQLVSQDVQNALKAVKANPNSSAAWSQLVQARYTAAGQSGNYNASTATFTSSGKQQLQGAAEAWQHYLALTNSPDPSVATIAARSYALLSQYGNAANAWAYVTVNSPTDAGAFECMAVTAYAAGQTRKGDLATSKVLSLLPKASQKQVKQELQGAKASSSVAQSLVSSNCAQ